MDGMRRNIINRTEKHVAGEAAPVWVAFHFYRKCFSIRSGSSRKVVGYTDSILLREVVFQVNRSGRERVLRERMKNVHAFVAGIPMDSAAELADQARRQWPEACYSPYLTDSFVDKLTGERITEAAYAWCEAGKVYYKPQI